MTRTPQDPREAKGEGSERPVFRPWSGELVQRRLPVEDKRPEDGEVRGECGERGGEVDEYRRVPFRHTAEHEATEDGEAGGGGASEEPN